MSTINLVFMNLKWLEVNIEPEMPMGDLVLKFAEPVVSNLEKKDLLESFHFLFEGSEFRFRVKVRDPKDYDEARKTVEEQLHALNETIYTFPEDKGKPYVGEVAVYGQEGWPIMELSLKMSTMIAFLLKPQESKVNKKVLEERMIHCFLNAQGNGLAQEIEILTNGICQRLGVIRQKGHSIDSLKQQIFDSIR